MAYLAAGQATCGTRGAANGTTAASRGGAYRVAMGRPESPTGAEIAAAVGRRHPGERHARHPKFARAPKLFTSHRLATKRTAHGSFRKLLAGVAAGAGPVVQLLPLSFKNILKNAVRSVRPLQPHVT